MHTVNLLSARFRYSDDLLASNDLSKIACDAKKNIERKIKEGIYKFEESVCFCGNTALYIFAERDRYDLYYRVGICEKCGLIRVNPRMTQDSYNKFYDKEYRTLYGDNDIDKDKLWKSRMKHAEEVYEFITKRAKDLNKGIVFDIGCNMGTALIPFWKKGFDVAGVDYGSEYIEFGRNISGLKNLYVGGIEKLEETGKKANLIILDHVIEHFLDLEAELRNIRKVMEPGAYIYIGVPNVFWWVRHICNGDTLGLLQNAHIHNFSLSTLTYLMECCGFEFLTGDDMIRAVFKKTNNFRDKGYAPKGEAKKIISFLKRNEIALIQKQRLIKLLIKVLEFFRVKKIVKNLLQNFGRKG